jgi:hypothetical protein
MTKPIKLEWHDTPYEMIIEHEQAVLDDIAKYVHEDLAEVSDLIFHHVFLTSDYGGPCVYVWGRDGSDAYQCEYMPHTLWGENIDDAG